MLGALSRVRAVLGNMGLGGLLPRLPPWVEASIAQLGEHGGAATTFDGTAATAAAAATSAAAARDLAGRLLRQVLRVPCDPPCLVPQGILSTLHPWY